jgi:hypothetical protein
MVKLVEQESEKRPPSDVAASLPKSIPTAKGFERGFALTGDGEHCAEPPGANAVTTMTTARNSFINGFIAFASLTHIFPMKYLVPTVS